MSKEDDDKDRDKSDEWWQNGSSKPSTYFLPIFTSAKEKSWVDFESIGEGHA